MEEWKQAIIDGNNCFCEENYSQAISDYRKATALAKQQLMTWFDTEAALNAVVVSELNLAEAFCRHQKFDCAINTYSTLSQYLRNFQDTFPDSTPIVQYAAKALVRVKREFLALTKTYDQDIIQLVATIPKNDYFKSELLKHIK